MKYIYIDNIARFFFFKNLLKLDLKKNNLFFLCDLPSVYFFLKKQNLKNIQLITDNKYKSFISKLITINFVKIYNLVPADFILLWNGKVKIQDKLVKLNKFKNKLFIENINLNNMFQFGNSGVNSFHETINFSNQKKNKYKGLELDPKIIILLNKAHPSNPNNNKLFGREKFKRSIKYLFIDIIFEPKIIIDTVFIFLYENLNKLAQRIFFLLKKLRLKRKSSKVKECILLQVHNDINYLENSIISYKELINKLNKKTNSDIYIKPRPQDFNFAFLLKIFHPFKIKFDYSSSTELLSEKGYKYFHTINSSYGACLAGNNSMAKVFFYGVSPLIGKNALKFTKNYLKSKEELSSIVRSYIE